MIDVRAIANLKEQGFRMGIGWEGALKRKSRPNKAEAMQQVDAWLRSNLESTMIQLAVWNVYVERLIARSLIPLFRLELWKVLSHWI